MVSNWTICPSNWTKKLFLFFRVKYSTGHCAPFWYKTDTTPANNRFWATFHSFSIERNGKIVALELILKLSVLNSPTRPPFEYFPAQWDFEYFSKLNIFRRCETKNFRRIEFFSTVWPFEISISKKGQKCFYSHVRRLPVIFMTMWNLEFYQKQFPNDLRAFLSLKLGANLCSSRFVLKRYYSCLCIF